MGTATHFLGVKQLGRDIAYHSSLSAVVDERKPVVSSQKGRGSEWTVVPVFYLYLFYL
jgi:hypothetical protein